MSKDIIGVNEGARVGAMLPSLDQAVWGFGFKIEKRLGDWSAEEVSNGSAPAPYEVIEEKGL